MSPIGGRLGITLFGAKQHNMHVKNTPTPSASGGYGIRCLLASEEPLFCFSSAGLWWEVPPPPTGAPPTSLSLSLARLACRCYWKHSC